MRTDFSDVMVFISMKQATKALLMSLKYIEVSWISNHEGMRSR
jgi:hypothetical protein